MKNRLFLLLLALCCIQTEGQNVTPGQFTTQVDQDFLFRFPFSKNEDRNYTQGTCFTYSHPDLINSAFFWPLRKIGQLDSDLIPYSTSVSLGGTAFTPRIIDSVNPIIGDRPFAFLLYLSTSSMFRKDKDVIRLNGNTETIPIYHTFNINFGFFGTKLGYEFQSFAHKNIVQGRPTDPKGWDTQISKGGQPTMLLDYSRFRPLPLLRIPMHNNERSLFDIGWNFGGSIGYYDRITSGLYGRLGNLKRDHQAKWNTSWASLNTANFQHTILANQKRNSFEYFIYGKITTTLMLRNSMLLGQRFFSSQYTLNPEWVKTGLIEYEWGLVFAWDHVRTNQQTPRTWALQFRTVCRSPEFNSKIFPERWHYFGGIGLLIPVG